MYVASELAEEDCRGRRDALVRSGVERRVRRVEVLRCIVRERVCALLFCEKDSTCRTNEKKRSKRK
jgi:hypothetical protein